jgi:hypothetical protein
MFWAYPHRDHVSNFSSDLLIRQQVPYLASKLLLRKRFHLEVCGKAGGIKNELTSLEIYV